METSNNLKPRILIVDDSADNIHILIETLKADYTIIPAKNGEVALAKAQTMKPDLILLDIVMPELDGYEVCRRLKGDERTKNIPVVFITAKSDAIDETKAFNLGAVDYITKPFVPIVVKVRVKNQIELKKKSDLLEYLVAVDCLTGLHNRRKFDETFELEWHRAQRNKTSLSLVMIDIDHFKQFNDFYGHAGGDECLRRVAAELQRNIKRATDFLARYGGEEFVVILPDTDNQGAQDVALHLREKIEALQIPHENSATANPVTISLGVASIQPYPGEQDPLILQKAADQMLYKAKMQGRNRVCGITIISRSNKSA